MYNMKQELLLRLQEDVRLVEAALSRSFRDRPAWGALHAAMEYSLLAGGKRIRPVLTLAFCRLCGGEIGAALPLAAAVEMVHTYSLIHDDLPCMDDDDFRRGKPTNHKVFGEAMAVLAGDALQAAAFETILNPAESAALPPARAAQAAYTLALGAGRRGMVGGQTLDLLGAAGTEEEILTLHGMKTGALLEAASVLGCIAAGAGEPETDAARDYARHLGLAFQIQDDLLDQTGDPAVLGKSTGSDRAAGKTTFVSLLGEDACRRRVAAETDAAKAALAGFAGRDDAAAEHEYLCFIADYLQNRNM